MVKNFSLYIFILFIELNLYTGKQILTGYLSSKYFTDSQHYINEDVEYSISMWIRVLLNVQTSGKTAILKLQNTIDSQMLNLSIDNTLQVMVFEDENNIIEQTDWPIPFQSGKTDFENHVTAYDKWLPIIISKNSSNTIFLFSFDTSSTHQYSNKNFSLSMQCYINFAPQNAEDYEVVFDSIVFRNFAIENSSDIKNYIYNNGYFGYYSYAGRSKNKQIYYNLNQTNEFNDFHLYFEEINSLLYEQDQLQNTYILHMPSFFDNHVYYICQYYIEMNFVFQSNFNSFQVGIDKQYTLYQRFLNYQNKTFDITFKFNFTMAINSSYYVSETVNFDNTHIVNLVSFRNYNISDTNTFQNNRSVLVSIYHYPISNFVKINQVDIRTLWYEARTTKNYNVDFQYSYYDQVKTSYISQNIMNYIIGSQIFKIIFYRDIIVNEDLLNQEYKYSLGQNKNIYLKTVSSATTILTDNIHIHDMTQIIEGQEGVINPGNFNYCKDAIPNCMFCIQHQCISCNYRYTLIDGKCIICTMNWIIFKNECLLETELHLTDPLNTGLIYDVSQLQLVSIKISYTSERDSAINFEVKQNFIMENETIFSELKTQLSSYYTTIKIRLATTNIFYVNEFLANDFSICKSTKYFRIQSDFSVICVDKCMVYEHVEQQRLCVKNIQGCLQQNENGCQQCETQYIQQELNGKIVCLPTKVEQSSQYIKNSLQPTTTTLANCNQQLSDATCMNCSTGFMLETTNYTCIVETGNYQDLRDVANCTEMTTSGRSQCIGQQTKIYLDHSTVARYVGPCKAGSVFHYTCNNCTANNYYMTSLVICQECLNYNTTTNQCEQCNADFQSINGECVYSSCKYLQTDCSLCNINNLSQCSSCNPGFYLKEIDGNFVCTSIKNCLNQTLQNFILTCTQCDTGYILLDSSNVQNLTAGVLCILESNYIENCGNYSIHTTEYECDYCLDNFIFLEQNLCVASLDIVPNCITYDMATAQCIACQTDYECQDINGIQTTPPCYQCIVQISQSSNTITNCDTHDSNNNCTSCISGYFSLDSNYIVSQNTINYCVDITYQIPNCQQYDSSFNCISCQTGFSCQDNNSIDTTPPCSLCNQTSNNTVQNCDTYDTNNNCILCLAGFFGLDLNYTISQYIIDYCVQDIYNVTNCYQYDNTFSCIVCDTEYICQDSNSINTSPPCSQCNLPANNSILNCSTYDISNYCTSCNIGYFCVDINRIVSTSICAECIDNSFEIQQCYQYDTNIDCIQCQQNFLCVDINYDISTNTCQHCFDETKYIYDCSNYDNFNICTSCKNNFTCLDNFNKISTNNCSWCINNSLLTPSCQQYNVDFQCIDCQTGFFCLDQYLKYLQNNICSFCIQDSFYIDNCYQYNQNYQCNQCTSNYFLGFYNNIYSCIQNQYQTSNCIEYDQNLDNSFYCILCLGNTQPTNYQCNQCDLDQIYVQLQQICIQQYNYVEYCIYYGNEQQCDVCQQNYFLIQIENKQNDQQQLQYICSEYNIDNCFLYQSIYECKQCNSNYQISQDMKECILLQDCTTQNCFNEQQQQILYQTIQNNCLLNVEYCDQCQLQNQNNCSKCQQEFQLYQNQCLYDCSSTNQINHYYQSQFCKEESQYNITIEDLCSQIYPNCEECQMLQNKLLCTKCIYYYYIEFGQCYNQIQSNDQECQFPCLDCNQLNQCISCRQSYQLLQYTCKQIIHQDEDIVCQGEFYCYKNGQIMNQHCQICKQICQVNFESEKIIFDQNIVFNSNIKTNSLSYFFLVDYLNNQIKINIKNQFEDTVVQLMRENIISSSEKCTPQPIYIFQIEKVKTTKVDQILTHANQSKNILPYFSLFLSSNFNLALQVILNEMKIFIHIGFLQMSSGNILQKLIDKNEQNVQNQNDMVIKEYFYDNFDIQYTVAQNQLDLSLIVGFFQNLLTELYVQIIYILLITLMLKLKFNKKYLQNYIINVKQIVFQYFLCKIISIQIGFLIFVQDFRIIVKYYKLLGVVFLLIVVVLFFSYFWFVHKIQKKYQKTLSQKRTKKNKLNLKKLQKSNINDLFLIYRITFLFAKLKVLYDFQNKILFALIFFIVITFFENKKMKLFDRFDYLKAIRRMDIIYNICLIAFSFFLVVQYSINYQISKYIYDSLFVFCLIMQLLMQIVFKIVTTYGKIRTKRDK